VAGGTGGHIYPGIAVAQAVRRRDPRAEILFLGSEEGMEKELVSRAGFSIKLIRSRALQRKLSYQALSAPFVSTIGFFQALAILRQFKPDKVLSTGGYASLPVVVAAWLLRLPVYLHEQNVLPGAVNRLVRRFARDCFLTFPGSAKYLQGTVVGNPVRREIIAADRAAARRKFGLQNAKVVLVLGGSQGARHINQVVIDSLKDIPSGVTILHVIGDRDYAWAMERLKGREREHYQTFSYVHDMAEMLAAADLAVSRAGATAIAEFLVRGIPMVLVPFPYAAEDHQRLNAEAIVAAGAGIMIADRAFNRDSFLDLLNESLASYDKMKGSVRRLASNDAAERIVEKIYG